MEEYTVVLKEEKILLEVDLKELKEDWKVVARV